MQWFLRVRVCDSCHHHVVTGELAEGLILELMDLRDRLAATLRPKVDTALRKRKLLSRQETIPRELAEDFIRATAWWLTHSSGSPVRAPRHADRLYLSPRHGWMVEFGANSFLVGRALERCRERTRGFFERIKNGDLPRRSEVECALQAAVAGSVANHMGEEYSRYPDNGRDLVFGAQSIDMADAVQFVIEITGIAEFLSSG